MTQPADPISNDGGNQPAPIAARMPDPPRPPRPVIKKMRWPFPIIWIVPIAAVCLAGYYLNQHHQENGIEITIQLDDGSGIKEKETTVSLHGVTIGHVQNVQMSDDHQHAIAHVELESSAEYVARTDTLFWLVRPELSLQSVTGLNTIVSGPYMDCRPGTGPIAHSFVAVPGAPKIVGPGISLILSADQITQLSVDSPVNYRGIQVGIVKDIRLSSTADSVNATVFIWDRYKGLVRTHSQFWMLKGADIQGSIFSGLKVKLGSVQSLLTGGVAFATPESDYGELVKDGESFVLHDQSKDDWLKWRPQFQLPPEDSEPGAQKAAADSGTSPLPEMKKE